VTVPSAAVTISDHAQLGSLESLLVRTIPELTVTRAARDVQPGELGIPDVLVVTFAGISAVADMIELIRAFLGSRDTETGVTITATSTSETKRLEVHGATDANVKDFLHWLSDE
jgi:hypothetical protein